MAGGRPPKYDFAKEAQDLLEWSEKDSSLSLLEFTDKKPYLAQQLSQFADHNEQFALALKKAKERISQRRADMCSAGKLNYGVWNRYAGLYDKQLHEYEQELKDLDSQRKLKENQVAHENDPLVAILGRISNRTKDLIEHDGKEIDAGE